MKNKQTYIIGEDTLNKKVNKPKKNKKPANKNKQTKEKSSPPINTAFADAFSKLGVSPKDFDKNSK